MNPVIREVDPAELRLPPSRISGADPWKLQREIAQFGSSRIGMPPIFVYENPNGVLEIYDGVTRATRIAKGGAGPKCIRGSYWSIQQKSRQSPARRRQNMSNNRAEVFTALQAVSAMAPQMRVGQLVAAIGEVCSDRSGRGLWDADDAELLEAIAEFRRGLENAGIAGIGAQPHGGKQE